MCKVWWGHVNKQYLCRATWCLNFCFQIQNYFNLFCKSNKTSILFQSFPKRISSWWYNLSLRKIINSCCCLSYLRLLYLQHIVNNNNKNICIKESEICKNRKHIASVPKRYIFFVEVVGIQCILINMYNES